MPTVTYEQIHSLITQANQDGNAMRVTFRCPVTGATFEARARLQQATSLAAKARKQARRRMAWSLRTAVASAARSAMGGGAAGSMASGAARGAVADVGTGQSFSDDDKKRAIVEAFQAIANQFVWDAHTNRFISFRAAGEVMSEFMQQLNAFPVDASYDRRICARMLTEIACADGHLGEDERVTPEEETRLAELARGLGVAEQRALQLKGFSQIYVVDQALRNAYTTGTRDDDAYAETRRLALRIGLAEADVARADVRFRKRYGLA